MKLKAEKRNQKGKSAVKKLRMKDKIPAILYGHNKTSIPLQLSKHDAIHLTEGEHLTLDFGESVDTIVKEIQWDPISFDMLHLDFQRLTKGEKVRVNIPLIIDGISAIIKKGGILEHKLSEVEIECLPSELIDGLKIDISNLNVGDSVYLKDLPEKKGILFIKDLDTKILTILAPKKIVEEKPEVEAEISEEEKKEKPEEKTVGRKQ